MIPNVSLGVTVNGAPELDTIYASVTCSGPPTDMISSYYVGSSWVHSRSDPGGATWKTVTGGGMLAIVRIGSTPTSNSFGDMGAPGATTIVPRLWLCDKNARGETTTIRRYTSYDDSAGHPFDIGLRIPDGGTLADCSVPPSWTGYSYSLSGWNSVPAEESSAWRISSSCVFLRHDWLVANGEDVAFTLSSRASSTTEDIPVPVVFHDLVQPLDGAPWTTGWVTWERTEIPLDIPNSCTTRPTDWTGTGGATVTGGGDHISLGTGSAGTLSRTLATRRRNRIRRLAAHLWTGSGDQQEVTRLWLLMTRANIDFATSGDDAKWWNPEATPWPGDEVGILKEDVTDWRSFSCVQFSVTGATEDIDVALKITYRTLSGYDPMYLGATYNFGAGDGEFEAEWSAQRTYSVAGKLVSGVAKFDLCPDSGNSPANLELVEKVELVFAAPSVAQSLTLAGWETVPYQSEHAADKVRMRLAHLWASDDWGAQVTVDGMPNYVPSYLSGGRRVEEGFHSTDHWQHNPDYEGSDDPTGIKSLSEWAGEWALAEHVLRPTWNQSAVNAVLVDVDDVALTTPIFGDMDEDGFGIHVRSITPNHWAVVYADCILQGGVRGVDKADGVRQLDQADGAIELVRSLDGGATKTVISSTGTNYVGEYIAIAGKEKSPATYYVRVHSGDTYTDTALGGFVNAERVWAAIAATSHRGGGIALCTTIFGTIFRAWVDADGDVQIHHLDLYPDGTVAWIPHGKAFSDGGRSNPHLDMNIHCHLIVTAEKDGVPSYSQSMNPFSPSPTWEVI
jgi:hypothetical protein